MDAAHHFASPKLGAVGWARSQCRRSHGAWLVSDIPTQARGGAGSQLEEVGPRTVRGVQAPPGGHRPEHSQHDLHLGHHVGAAQDVESQLQVRVGWLTQPAADLAAILSVMH